MAAGLGPLVKESEGGRERQADSGDDVVVGGEERAKRSYGAIDKECWEVISTILS